MKKDQGYMTRALQARDPRFAEILGKLGHAAEAPAEADRAPRKTDDEESNLQKTQNTPSLKKPKRRKKKAAN